MNTTCTNVYEHSQVEWPLDQDGDRHCPFENPIRRPGSDLYWSYPLEGGMVSFDDLERIATVYPVADVEEDGEPRAYTEEENARADAIATASSIAEAQAALDRAVQVNAAPEELKDLQEANLSAEGIEDGDPWRQPTGAQDAYPIDATVTHNGSSWQSTVAANVWEPGVSGWRPVGEGPQPWVQPTGAHDAYNTGDLVTHEGKTWRSNINSNVWEPPEQWTEVVDPEDPDQSLPIEPEE